MRRLLVLILVCVSHLANAQDFLNLRDDALDFSSRSGGSAAVSCTYMSVDQHGDSLLLSGKVFIPKGGIARGIILLPHYTVAANSEVPSACKPIEARLADKGYVLVMPDYQGYGISSVKDGKAQLHPYLDASLAARQTVDMFLVARSFLERSHVTTLNDNLLIVGFSQGAAVAVASLRLLEEEHPEVSIKRCYAGSGPYDVCATYDDAVRRNRLGMAVVVPLLVMGTSEAYDLHLRPEDFFTPYLLERYKPIVYDKRYGLVRLAFTMPSRKLSKYMTNEGMDKLQPETARMYEGFKRSSIVCVTETDTIYPDWTPRAPITLFHSTNDDIVCFDCALHMSAFLGTRGANFVTHFGRYGGHLASLLRYMHFLEEEL